MSQISTENTALEPESVYTLTALDRCDSCGAQAYVRVTMQSGELLFCAHHGAEFKEKLSATALHWHDESDRLVDASRN
jgi:predicted nucleic acid-binding Zn ribbon protein